MREFVACLNAGDVLRAIALYSDDFLRRLLAEEDDLDAETFVQTIPPVTPVPEGERAAVAVDEVRLYPDGRAGAFVVIGPVGDTEPAEDFVIFVEVDGRWLVDDVIAGAETDSVPEATPTIATG